MSGVRGIDEILCLGALDLADNKIIKVGQKAVPCKVLQAVIQVRIVRVFGNMFKNKMRVNLGEQFLRFLNHKAGFVERNFVKQRVHECCFPGCALSCKDHTLPVSCLIDQVVCDRIIQHACLFQVIKVSLLIRDLTDMQLRVIDIVNIRRCEVHPHTEFRVRCNI